MKPISVFGIVAAVAFFLPQKTLAACEDMPAFLESGELGVLFCRQVREANARNVVPVIKKPKCGKGGPASSDKCNPASIILPDMDLAGVAWAEENGSFGFRVLTDLNGNGSADFAALVKNLHSRGLLDGNDSNVLSSGANALGGFDFDWQMTAPGAMDADDEFQFVLRQTLPWLERAMGEGDAVYFVVQEN